MKAILPIVLAILLLFGGCGLFEKKLEVTNKPELNTGEDVSQAQNVIANSTEAIQVATNDITKKAQTIKDETGKAKGKVPPEVKKQIDPHLTKIDESSTAIAKNTHDINKAVAELAGADSLLVNAGEKIKNIEKALDNMTKERDTAIKRMKEAQEEASSQMKKALRWIIVGCIVLAGVFAVLFVLHGSKFGLTGAAICAVVCAIAVFVQTYFVYLAIAGGLILLGLIAALVYQIIMKNKAFKEVVDTVEVVQDNLDPTKKTELFGGEGETGMMDTIQSPETIRLVKKAKNKLGSLWEYAKHKEGKEENK